jgi:LuxR family maltose regulon positive regulatory protein
MYEAGELDRAEHLLNVYLPLASDVGLPDHMILSHVMRARLAQWHGDVDLAMQTLADLETLGQQRQMRRVAAAAQLERAHLATTRGQRAQAAAQLLQAEDDALWARERRQVLIANETQYLRLAQLRWQLAFGDAGELDAVARGLEAEIALAFQGRRQRRLLVLQVLLATVLERLGHWHRARPLLLDALAAAAQEGHVRLLLDEGPAVVRTLRRLQAEHACDVAGQPALAEHLDRLLAAARPMWVRCEAQATDPIELPPPLPGDEADAESDAGKVAGCEGLTQRERQVLELLALGYSNGAMAEKLFLSDSTVRTHLRSINAKMGARSRTHAVALARQAGLVQ